MPLTNNANLPEPLVRAILRDPYGQGRRRTDISVTGLINSPRITQLRKRHREEITEDVVDKVYALLGQAVHAVLERGVRLHDREIEEGILYADCHGWTIGGQADLWREPGILSDYKMCSVWAFMLGSKPEWEAQLNLYAHLYRLAGFPVERAEIVAIYRDWSLAKSRQGGNYPQEQVGIHHIPLWGEDQCRAYLRDRVMAHQWASHLEDEDLPFCTPAERWEKPTTWAVMKNANKTATQLHDCEEAAWLSIAEVWLPKWPKASFTVVERPGEPTRCLHYCPVAPFCNQRQAEIEAEAGQDADGPGQEGGQA